MTRWCIHPLALEFLLCVSSPPTPGLGDREGGGSEQPYRGKREVVISELSKDGKHTLSPGLAYGCTSDTTRNLHAPGVQVGTRPFLCQLDEARVETCLEDLVQRFGAFSHDL